MFGALLVLVTALFSALAGCSGSEEDVSNPPPSPEEASSVVVRVSGEEGTAYVGNYGGLDTEPQLVEDTLGTEPMEYEVEAEGGASNGVTALFEKSQPSEGELKAEIVADGEVVTESRTRAETGTVVVEWLPEEGLPEDVE